MKRRNGSESKAYSIKSGVRERHERVNWQELAKLAAEGALRVEAKYGRYVEPARLDVRARECA